MEDKRTALIGIIVEDTESVAKLNGLLHEYREAIIGRMGLPRPERELALISVALEADNNTISALAGKLGALPGVQAKTVYAKNR